MEDHVSDRILMSVRQERTIYPHAVFLSAARSQLQLAEEREEGQFFTCLMTAISCAFALEAFLNVLGAAKVTHWDILERKLDPLEKLVIVSDAVGLQIDRGRRPFQLFSELFRFRSAVAHGRVETIRDERDVNLLPEERLDPPEADWERFATLENVRRLMNDTEAMAEQLRVAADMPKLILNSLADGLSEYRRHRDD